MKLKYNRTRDWNWILLALMNLLNLVGQIQFSSLRKYTEYKVLVRSISKQIHKDAAFPEETIFGDFSQPFKLRTQDDGINLNFSDHYWRDLSKPSMQVLSVAGCSSPRHEQNRHRFWKITIAKWLLLIERTESRLNRGSYRYDYQHVSIYSSGKSAKFYRTIWFIVSECQFHLGSPSWTERHYHWLLLISLDRKFGTGVQFFTRSTAFLLECPNIMPKIYGIYASKNKMRIRRIEPNGIPGITSMYGSCVYHMSRKDGLLIIL